MEFFSPNHEQSPVRFIHLFTPTTHTKQPRSRTNGDTGSRASPAPIAWITGLIKASQCLWSESRPIPHRSAPARNTNTRISPCWVIEPFHTRPQPQSFEALSPLCKVHTSKDLLVYFRHFLKPAIYWTTSGPNNFTFVPVVTAPNAVVQDSHQKVEWGTFPNPRI
jgi:hypothetical protein